MRKLTRIGLMAASLSLVTATAWAGTQTFQGFTVINVVVNGKPVGGDVPAVNFYGRTVLPVRAVAEAIGAAVDWQAETSTVVLTVPDAAALQTKLAQKEAELVKVKAELETKIGLSAPPAPGQPGSNRVSPAPFGTAVNVKVDGFTQQITAKVTVLETIRGDEAWTRLKAANEFNGAAKPGTEYMLAKVRFELLEINDTNQAYDLSNASFAAISGSGRQYDKVFMVRPDPKLDSKLYVKATSEGWTAFQVGTDDPAPLLAFGRDYQGAGGAWFKTTK